MPELNALVTQRVDFAPDLMILRVAPDGWELPEFSPGQYCLLGLPASAPRAPDAGREDPVPEPDEFIRRAYSIASSSAEREYVEFYIAHVRSGALTPRLFALRVGDRVHLSAKVTGMFTLDEVPPDQNLVLIGIWGFEPAPDNSHVFLCGNPLMIEAMKGLLAGEGFTLHHRRSPGRVHVEEF